MSRLLHCALLLLALLLARPAFACEGAAAVCPEGGPGAVALVTSSRPAAILSDPGDDAGVLRAVRDLRADLRRVAGQAAESPDEGPVAIIVGTLGRQRADRPARARAGASTSPTSAANGRPMSTRSSTTRRRASTARW